jgi:hypothetical protein
VSLVAGFDYDSHGAYVVFLDEDTGAVVRPVRYDLDVGPGNALQRAQRLRDVMPARDSWRDEGVVAIGIEEPFSNDFKAATSLARVQGALLACLPRDVPVFPVTPNGRKTPGWKLLSLGRTNSSKDDVRAWSLEHGGRTFWNPNLFDAHAIAWATRRLHRRERIDADDAES